MKQRAHDRAKARNWPWSCGQVAASFKKQPLGRCRSVSKIVHKVRFFLGNIKDRLGAIAPQTEQERANVHGQSTRASAIEQALNSV
jgi:hypothetical protein